MTRFTIGACHVGSSEALTEPQARRIAVLIEQPAPDAPPGLGGRRALVRAEIPTVGAVVVKAYWRGGWVRHFVQRRHLGIGKCRAEREYEALRFVRAAGIDAPEPIAFAWRGRLAVTAWLILREIPGAVTLAELSRAEEVRLREVFPGLVAQVALMVRRGIYHVDLHPGNVLVDADGRVRIVDFDKCRTFAGDRKRLLERYLRRWNRAVRKHRLPPALGEMLAAGLERSHAPLPG